MASQEHHLRQHSPHNTPGADFEVAESLPQHSRGGCEANGDAMPIATEEYSTESPNLNEGVRVGDGTSEHGQGGRQSNSQEPQAESQYAPISNPPAFGQVCRLA